MTDPVIEVENLTKSFGRVKAVDRVSFRLAPGEILGLLGPNGAGKTTTIQLLLGLTTPDSGRIRVLGLDVAKDRRRVLGRVNFASAYATLPTNLTVWENLHVFACLYGLKKPRPKIESLLRLFEIETEIHRRTGALSSGQVTRLTLAKAFLNDPEVLFLDEPTASLDPDMAAKVREVLKKIQREQGVSMVYTTHNMLEAERVCDRVMFISRGRIVLSGRPADVVNQGGPQTLEEVFIAIARGGDLVALNAAEAS